MIVADFRVVFLYLLIFACFDFIYPTYSSIIYGIKGIHDQYEEYDK